ncbi:MAG: type VI secretion system tip protein TssI/VgrG [Polyangiaceae bacterium]
MASADTHDDFAFHWDGGGAEFRHLEVVRLDIDDALSTPFEVKLVLIARGEDDELDPHDLVGKLGTLRIATTAEPPVRPFHGLIVSAEDRGTSHAGRLYEVTLLPPLARAMHRKRSRIFFEKTLREIVEAVLTGDPRMSAGDSDASSPDDLRSAFHVPDEKFAWRVSDASRIDDPKVRPHCAQYNETDFDFVARLLEEEGIAYHFDHTDKQIVFVMSDTDSGMLPLDPADALGPAVRGRQLDDLRLGARLRPTKVKLVEYNWQKPRLDMASEKRGDADELFVEKYPGRFHESPSQGDKLVQARLDRFHVEARVATAHGSCRLLGAGTILGYAGSARTEGEYLVTRARLRGVAPGVLAPGETGADGAQVTLPNGTSFHAELELARRGTGKSLAESRYRPPRKTEKPRIFGTQTATVVDDPTARGAEIHVGGPPGNENGCVRLRFHWDTETARHDKEPTSMWVRVSQLFAGAGGGSVAHPRVGTEVIVCYEDGDPDRPIVVGRVYNGIQPSAALERELRRSRR